MGWTAGARRGKEKENKTTQQQKKHVTKVLRSHAVHSVGLDQKTALRGVKRPAPALTRTAAALPPHATKPLPGSSCFLRGDPAAAPPGRCAPDAPGPSSPCSPSPSPPAPQPGPARPRCRCQRPQPARPPAPSPSQKTPERCRPLRPPRPAPRAPPRPPGPQAARVPHKGEAGAPAPGPGRAAPPPAQRAPRPFPARSGESPRPLPRPQRGSPPAALTGGGGGRGGLPPGRSRLVSVTLPCGPGRGRRREGSRRWPHAEHTTLLAPRVGSRPLRQWRCAAPAAHQSPRARAAQGRAGGGRS